MTSKKTFNYTYKLLAFLALAFGLTIFIHDFVLAQSIYVPPIGNYGGTVQDPGQPGTIDLGISSLVIGFVMNTRFIIGAIAVLMMIIAGFKMVTAQGDSGVLTKAKTTIVWSLLGLALIGLAGELARIFAVGQCSGLGMLPSSNNVGCIPGGFLANPNIIIQRSTIFNQTIQYIITAIKYAIGAVAVLMLTRSALRMIWNQAGEELEKDKKNVVASITGLFLIIIANPIINNVFFKIDTSRYPSTGAPAAGIDVGQGIKEIIGFTNFLVSILGPLAIFFIVFGGILYATSGANPDNQEKGKRMIFLSLIGLLIIYGAFAIVSTFVSGKFSTAPSTTPITIQKTINNTS